MLGDDNSNALTLEDVGTESSKSSGKKKRTENVVILGYEDDDSNVQTETMTKVATRTSSKTDVPSHLYCLKEPCRFYKEKTGDCQFDLMMSALESQQAKSPKGATSSQQISKDIAKDVDKIWKFQTKSVTELVKSFGEAEKNQTKAVTNLQKDLEKSLDILAAKVEKSPAGDMKKTITTLHKRLDEREQGIQDLSSTMSELVLNLHESISKLEDKSETAFKEIGKLSGSIPDMAALKETLAESVVGESAIRKVVEDSMVGESAIRKVVEDSMVGESAIRKAVEDSIHSESAIKKMVEESIDKKLKSLDPPDLSKPISDLSHQLEELFRSQHDSTPDFADKLDAAMKAQNKMESRSDAWHEEISEKMQDVKTQQKIWEERFKKLAERQDQILEHLDDLKKQRDTHQSRTGQKEAKKFNNLGVTSFHNGAFEMARDQFLEAVNVDPDFAEAYNNLGLAYTELDDEEKATEAFSRAVELNPSLHAAYNNLGYIFFKKGDYDQAIEMYNEALGRSTHNSSAYTNLGNAYFKLDRIEDAKLAWSKALEIDPGNEKAKRNLDRIGEDAD
jgi:Flp pilus assembly protein TadD